MYMSYELIALADASYQVNWDGSKDEALWKILSGVAKTEIDCKLSSSIYIQPHFPLYLRNNV